MSNLPVVVPFANAPCRLVLVDDHPILRAGLKVLLDSQAGLSVLAEADSGSTAIELIGRVSPDLVVMDVSLTGMSGAETTRQLKGLWPHLPILALSAHESPGFVRMMLDAGVDGYALKRAACDELVRAVRTVAAGGTYVDPSISGQLLRSNGAPGKAVTSLSEREAEVVRLLAQGMSMKEIAQQLAVSPRTLETYRARAMEKLSLRSRADLVRYAFRNGWLEP
jgi:DNA-binding NarL/FixJ family response regulator